MMCLRTWTNMKMSLFWELGWVLWSCQASAACRSQKLKTKLVQLPASSNWTIVDCCLACFCPLNRCGVEPTMAVLMFEPVRLKINVFVLPDDEQCFVVRFCFVSLVSWQTFQRCIQMTDWSAKKKESEPSLLQRDCNGRIPTFLCWLFFHSFLVHRPLIFPFCESVCIIKIAKHSFAADSDMFSNIISIFLSDLWLGCVGRDLNNTWSHSQQRLSSNASCQRTHSWKTGCSFFELHVQPNVDAHKLAGDYIANHKEKNCSPVRMLPTSGMPMNSCCKCHFELEKNSMTMAIKPTKQVQLQRGRFNDIEWEAPRMAANRLHKHTTNEHQPTSQCAISLPCWESLTQMWQSEASSWLHDMQCWHWRFCTCLSLPQPQSVNCLWAWTHSRRVCHEEKQQEPSKNACSLPLHPVVQS